MLDLLGFHLVRVGLCLLSLVWLDTLASWHPLNFEQKNQWNLSKRVTTPKRFEVEHDFPKARVPREILNLLCPPSQLHQIFKPITLLTRPKRYKSQVYIYSKLIHTRFWAILKQLFGSSLHSFLNDQQGRGVVVCCEAEVSHLACLICSALVALLACLFACLLAYLLWFTCLVCFASLLDLRCFAMICDAWIARFHFVRLGLCLLGLVWLGRIASWHALGFEQKNTSYLSERTPTPAKMEVEHVF